MLMVGKMIASVIPSLIGRAADYFKNKRELKNTVEVAKIAVVREKGMVDANWESSQATASKDSWKDEFWTLVFGYLLLSPLWAPDQMAAVFSAYAEAPQWFQLCVLVSVGSSFGVKIWKVLTPSKR